MQPSSNSGNHLSASVAFSMSAMAAGDDYKNKSSVAPSAHSRRGHRHDVGPIKLPQYVLRRAASM